MDRYSPAFPSATRRPSVDWWGRLKAHSFAPPPRDGFALSRMKGVCAPGAPGLAPDQITKADLAVRYPTVEQTCTLRKLPVIGTSSEGSGSEFPIPAGKLDFFNPQARTS